MVRQPLVEGQQGGHRPAELRLRHSNVGRSDTVAGRDIPFEPPPELAVFKREAVLAHPLTLDLDAEGLDRAVGELIAEVDTTIEPVAERLGEPAQSVVKQAQELRDQLRSYLNDQLVA
jgi:hypothetical protein